VTTYVPDILQRLCFGLHKRDHNSKNAQFARNASVKAEWLDDKRSRERERGRGRERDRQSGRGSDKMEEADDEEGGSSALVGCLVASQDPNRPLFFVKQVD
jgi:hypothetical protein